MPRDFKHAAARGRKRRVSAGVWWAALVGITLTVIVGGTAAYYLQRGSAAPAPRGAAAPPQSAAPAPRPAPDPSPPQFEFYTLLPQMEMVITEAELDDANSALPKIDRSGPYILQAGSFRAFADADGLKARLALIGVEARIQTVIIDDANTWHRVRIGPYDSLKEVKKVRGLLKRNHIDFVLLRIGA